MINHSFRIPVLLVAAGFLVFLPYLSHAAPQSCANLPLDLLDIVVTPHQYSQELRYAEKIDPELGALVRLVFFHRDPGGKPVLPEITFNGRHPSELLDAKEWQWHETPENLNTPGQPCQILPGEWAVFTFNAGAKSWGLGNSFTLKVTDTASGLADTLEVPIIAAPVRLRSIVFRADKNDAPAPDRIIVHLSNDSGQSLRVMSVAACTTDLLRDRLQAETLETRPHNGAIASGERGLVMARFGKALPLRHGLLEVVTESLDGKRESHWAPLRFKMDRFDIGSGWLEVPSKPGIVPLTQESFLKTLQRMHVNTVHAEQVAGYTDSVGPEGLYTRYPMRFMSGLREITKFNADEWVGRIHGVDILGEPQMNMTPMASYEALRPYKAARYPTTVTLSDEKDWRYFAGLSDFPHFDAYRVSAPAMDNFYKYDRWDKKIMWGAPMEGIGVLTRSLREQSEPRPIAFWSQNAHEGWQSEFSRKRRSPTPDEILAQAYQGLANGVISLYWYSLQSWSLLKYRDCIDITTRLDREIRLFDDLYLSGAATHHQRLQQNGKPDLDLNVIASPDAALLFALDLNYYPDHEEKVFKFRGPRAFAADYPLPGWLCNPVEIFRMNADGLYPVKWSATETGVHIEDTLDKAAVYVVAKRVEEKTERLAKLEQLKADEAAVNFDPAGNDADFAKLAGDLGFKDLKELDKYK